jgi:HD-GYP domain-containing protein (c-di-GMP phosphodiesterase class II)
MDNGKYLAIPPGAIIPGGLPNFRIYFLSPQGRYVLWALDGKKVTSEQLVRLSDSGIQEVYIDPDEKFKYDEYLENNLGEILENEAASIEQKAEIFSRVSTRVLEAAFETSFGLDALGPSLLQRMGKMVGNALIFISESKSLPALAQMIGHDYKTFEHATKVLWFTVAFLRENPFILEIIRPDYQNYDENQKMELLRQCGVSALLHDIGKVLISPEIINKNGPLNEIEWEIMKRHPFNSLAMLLDTDVPEFVKKAILQHHEDFDGGGYPMNLRGLHITILARVLRITDTFDAMTSRRPYKDPIPPKKAMEIMIGIPPAKKEEDGAVGMDPDQGMLQCFDEDLLRKFILFLGKMDLDE